MTFLLNLSYVTRPNRAESTKRDVDYHVKTARYFCSLGTSNTMHSQWLDRIQRNRSYRLGDQWMEGSNAVAFLTDSSNNEKGRIKWTLNYVYRIAQAFISNAEKMDVSFRAQNISPNALTRKEEQKEYLGFLNSAIEYSPDNIKNYVHQNLPIGHNEQQTEEIFEMSYSDKVAKSVNILLENAKNENLIDKYKAQLGADMIDSGICCIEGNIDSPYMNLQRILPERLILDRRCKNSDFGDSEYMGYWSDYDTVYLFEKYQGLPLEDRITLERFSANGYTNNVPDNDIGSFMTNNRIPVVRVYWRDVSVSKWAYVYNDDGLAVLRMVNHIYEGDTEVRYTDKDIVPLKELNMVQKETLIWKESSDMYLGVLRYCDFIPFEYIPTDKHNEKKNVHDIVLEYGELPFQESELHNPNNCLFPMKIASWIFANGDVDTPISYLIDPQDLINRYESIRENHMAHLPLGALLYDKDMLNGQDGNDEAALIRAVNTGEPFGLEARRSGMNNAVSYTQPNYQGIAGIFEVINTIKMRAQEIVGVNDSFLASTQGQDKLVGTSALEIQQSTNLQFPFFNAITHIYEQLYEFIANPYRKSLAYNNHKLVAVMGGNRAVELSFLKEHNIEDVRVFVKRSNNVDELKKQADAEMVQFLQMGLRPETFASMLHRSTPEDVQQALYRDIMMAKIAQTNAMQNKAAQANAGGDDILKAGIAEQNDNELARDQSTHNISVKGQNDMNKQIVKSASDIASRKMDIEAKNVENAGMMSEPPERE